MGMQMNNFERVLESLFAETVSSGGFPIIGGTHYITSSTVSRIASREEVPISDVLDVISKIGGTIIAKYHDDFCIIFPEMFPKKVLDLIKKAADLLDEIYKKLFSQPLDLFANFVGSMGRYISLKKKQFPYAVKYLMDIIREYGLIEYIGVKTYGEITSTVYRTKRKLAYIYTLKHDDAQLYYVAMNPRFISRRLEDLIKEYELQRRIFNITQELLRNFRETARKALEILNKYKKRYLRWSILSGICNTLKYSASWSYANLGTITNIDEARIFSFVAFGFPATYAICPLVDRSAAIYFPRMVLTDDGRIINLMEMINRKIEGSLHVFETLFVLRLL